MQTPRLSQAEWRFADAEPSFEQEELDTMTALPKDPTSLYVFWEVSGNRIRMAERHFGMPWDQLRKGLRIYDVNALDFKGDYANRSWRQELGDVTSQWFFHGLSPDCHYVVDFGIMTEPDGFFTLLRSNPVKLPPDRPYPMNGQHEPHAVTGPALEDVLLAEAPVWADQFTGYSLHSAGNGKERS